MSQSTILVRQKMWLHIRENKEFTVESLAKAGEVSTGTARQYTKGLCQKGIVAVVIGKRLNKSGKKTIYQLEKDLGAHAPQVRADGIEDPRYRALKNLWRTMKVRKFFNVKDLIASSSNDECVITEKFALDYCEALSDAGYLQKSLRSNDVRTGDLQNFVMIGQRYSGPMPPIVQKVTQVFDLNERKVVFAGR